MCTLNNADYPAGHSMDTEWFAVDKDGNVALFDTGEEGVLPVEYKGEFDFSEFIEKYSTPVSKVLRNFFLCDEQVEIIAKECNKVALSELISLNMNEDVLYFTGFFLLGEGFTYADLDFDNNVKNIGYKYEGNIVFCLSQKRQLYYIDDAWGLKEAFYEAVKEDKIISCISSYDWKENECDDEGEEVCFQFGMSKYENSYARGPYEREHLPKFPININQLPQEAKEEILIYPKLSFKANKYIQPMEFGSCKPYGIDSITHETEWEKKEEGYAKVILSDNETEAYCKIPSAYWIANKDRYRCNKCNDDISWYELYHPAVETNSDSPRVMVITPHLFNVKPWEYEKKLNKQVLKKLGIQTNDFYLSACVKCYTSNSAPKNNELIERFRNCKHWLNTEIQLLEPCLIICLGRKTFTMLSEHFDLGTSNFQQGIISTLKTESITIPLLIVGKLNSPSENIEDLSQQVKTILSQKKERIINKKPQVLR